MATKYKVSLFSADGSQFLRKIAITVPSARSDGTGTPVNTTGQQTTAAPCINAMNTGAGTNIYFTENVHIFCGRGINNNDTTLMGSMGWNVIDPALWAGPGVRLVFSNKSYIKFIPSVTAGQQKITVEFYLENDQLVTSGLVNAGIASGASQGNYYQQCSTLPFVLRNVDGSISDWTARYGGPGIWCYRDDSRRWCYVANGTLNCGRISSVSLQTWYEGIEPYDEDDPYSDIDDSTPSGPAEGTGIPENDPVDIPDLPTVSAIDTGFVSLFNPTMAEVKALADYMWTDTLFDINNFRKIFADPMDCILGFNVVPVDVPASGRGYVCVGNIQSTVQMTLATSQWVEVNCGSLDLGLPYGNYLDFAPASKYSIYLPYIGIKELSTDDVAGKVLTLKYHVDVLSCACIAYLKCGDSVLYQFAGSCGYSIPVTGTDFSRMIGSIIDIGLQAGSLATGNVNAVGSIAKDVMGLKPDVHRAGSIGSSTGLMGLQVPFLILELPNACKPKKQYHYLGYPSFVTVKLGDISGFASFENVLLEGIPCTDAEREIILSMCKGGIYL